MVSGSMGLGMDWSTEWERATEAENRRCLLQEPRYCWSLLQARHISFPTLVQELVFLSTEACAPLC